MFTCTSANSGETNTIFNISSQRKLYNSWQILSCQTILEISSWVTMETCPDFRTNSGPTYSECLHSVVIYIRYHAFLNCVILVKIQSSLLTTLILLRMLCANFEISHPIPIPKSMFYPVQASVTPQTFKSNFPQDSDSIYPLYHSFACSKDKTSCGFSSEIFDKPLNSKQQTYNHIGQDSGHRECHARGIRYCHRLFRMPPCYHSWFPFAHVSCDHSDLSHQKKTS